MGRPADRPAAQPAGPDPTRPDHLGQRQPERARQPAHGLVQPRHRRPRPAAAPHGLRPGPDHRAQRRHGRQQLGRQLELLQPLRGRGPGQLPRPAGEGDVFLPDGPLSDVLREPQGRPGPRHHARRKLRPRDHAAVFDRADGTGPRRHAAARRRGPADPDLRQRRHQSVRPGLHRLPPFAAGPGPRRAAGDPDADGPQHPRLRPPSSC